GGTARPRGAPHPRDGAREPRAGRSPGRVRPPGGPAAMSAPRTGIHPTAVIDEPCEIGESTRIWHFCHVMAGAPIRNRCVPGPNVFVAGRVKIGRGCRIQNNVSLYDGVELEPEVFVGPSAVFTNVSYPRAGHPRKDRFEPTLVREGATIGANATIRCGVVVGR